MTLVDLSLAEMRDGLRSRAFSSRELVLACLERIAATRDLNAFITEPTEQALEDADRADRNIADGAGRALEGIPIAVKDMFCTKGVRTTAASRILENFVPPYESTVTQRLWGAGAILAGKTNQDEFAMGSSCLTSAFGPVKNPRKSANSDRDLVPGGSSGGSAAVVAAGVVPAALGTDTGGSIRQPASFCGIVGLKPSYGRCSRRGIVAYASSLDQAGPLTRTVRDAAIVLREIAGNDALDSTCVDRPVPNYERAVGQSIKGLRVGIPTEYRVKGLRPDVVATWDRAIAVLKEAGAEIVHVSLPLTKYALPTYYVVALAEASSNLARYDGTRFGLRVEGKDPNEMYENTRASGFGAEVQRRVLMGTYVLSAGYYDAYYKRAQQVRRLLSNEFAEVFKTVDTLLFPTSPIPAFPIAEEGFLDDPVAMYLIDVFTVTVNLVGLPAVSIPFGLSTEGLPLGLQVMGRYFDEEAILRTGEVLFKAI